MHHTATGKSGFRESGLMQRMRKSVRELPMSRSHVLLACSGGKDSVALAFLLAELRRLDLIQVSLAHIHHGQHDQADLATDAVREIGRMLDVSVSVKHLQQKDIESHQGVGLEEAMRRERYLALSRIASERHAECIAMAHHQTDQAETILMHLIRGSGIDGLAGMRSWEMREIPWWTNEETRHDTGLWRPLLSESEEDIVTIAEQSGLPIVHDPTNTDVSFRRNAIRHQVLPMLQHIAPGSIASIARTADVVARDAQVLQQMTDCSLQDCLREDGLVRASVAQLSLDLQGRVVRQWLQDRLPNVEISADRVDAIVDLVLRKRGGSQIEIGLGRKVILQDGMLLIG